MDYIAFILNSKEYRATFENGDCTSIYVISERRYLSVDPETGEREHPHVWTAAYTMFES